MNEIKGNDPTGAGQTRIQTDLIKAETVLIKAETDKIDNTVVDGLAGVEGSLAYDLEIVENHHHNYERWMAAAAVPAGETHVADSINDNQTPFQADGGNDTWGPWIQVLGSTDTPVIAAMVKFDLHRILIVNHERNNTLHQFQLAFGDSGAAALVAETYTEFVVSTGGGNTEVGPVEIINKRGDAGTKAWVRVWAVGQNTGTLDFLVGLHEYEG